jgi:hypothetical protein
MNRMFVLFAILAALGIASAAFSVSGSANKAVYSPGEPGVLTFSLSNTGTSTLANAILEVSGSSEFQYSSTFNVGDMNPATGTTITIPIRSRAATPSGIYIFNIKVYGNEIESDGTRPLNYKEASVPVYVLNEPVLFIDNYSKYINESQNFKFTIMNTGGAASKVRVGVLEPFSLIGANEYYAGSLTNSTTLSLPIDVSDAPLGKNTLQLTLTYQDELGNQVTDTKDIGISVNKESPDISITQASKMTARANSQVHFTVKNGPRPLSDVKFAFDNDSLLLGSGGIVRVGDFAANEQKDVVVGIYPDIQPGTSSTPLTITYTDNGRVKTYSTKAVLTVDSDSNVQVYLESKPSPVVAGGEHTFSVTVANTWDYQISSTSVKISGDFFDLQNVQDEQFIGLLKAEDFSSVQFKIRAHANTTANGTLTVRVKYKDPFGNFVERTQDIPVQVTAAQQQEGGILPILLVLALVVGGVYWFFIRKKK